jgi:hypothetical protein
MIAYARKKTHGLLKIIIEYLKANKKRANQNKHLKMNKLNKFFADHGSKMIIALLILLYFKSCGVDSEVERVKKDVRGLTAEIDTLNATFNSTVITEEKMIDLIKETPAWKTLRIEEISDKERISINALEEKED